MDGITSGELMELREKEGIGPIDIHFARLMEELAGQSRVLFLASCFLSNQTRMGHVCLNLDDDYFRKRVESSPGGGEGDQNWRSVLSTSKVVGKQGERKPMILDDEGRLYLFRYHEYQRSLAKTLLEKAGQSRKTVPGFETRLKAKLDRLFGEHCPGSSPDLQKTAACLSFLNGFSVISGGPGTGKTTTVARLLVLYAESYLEQTGAEKESSERKRFTMVLCAPTGKAAQRLKESLNLALEKLDLRDDVRRMIPNDVLTIHRLLGTIPGSPYFRHHEKNLLNADLVVVDEASMVDLALMSKLVSALSPETALVLLGDKDQLASVEAGSVLGDICGPLTENVYSGEISEILEKCTGFRVTAAGGPLSDTGMENVITMLDKSYRFDNTSGIGRLAKAANSGNPSDVFSAFSNGDSRDAVFETLPEKHALKEKLGVLIRDTYARSITFSSIPDAFAALDHFRILCAVREGTFGVHNLNRTVLEILVEQAGVDPGDEWYPGRPVMIFRNDYNLRLFNGDVGITAHDGGYGRKRRVYFKGHDGTLRSFKPDQLPEHETAFAMTVHKSQGSEFGRVLLILPDRDNPILTRELLYTGVTRAREHVTLMASEAVLRQAVTRKLERRTGLRNLLWPGRPA